MKKYLLIIFSLLMVFTSKISFALTEKDFQVSMNFYSRLVEKKASVEELVYTLEKILNKYKNVEVNLAPVRQKLLALKAFKNSKDFYKKLEERKAGREERVAALRRIIAKYRNIDADISGMEKKLAELEALKEGKVEELTEEFTVTEETAPAKVEKGVEGSSLEEKLEESKEGEKKGSEIEEDLEEFEEFKP